MIYPDENIIRFIAVIKKEYNDLKKDLQSHPNDKREAEFEIRITDSNKNHSISEDLYKELIYKCKGYKSKITNSIVNSYKENFREIITDQEKIYQIKEGKQNEDRSFSKKENNKKSYNIRYSYCVEKTILQASGKISKSRKRERIEFDTGKGYIYFLTKVTVKSKVTYEFEIEFDIEKLTFDLIKDSLLIIDDKFDSNLSIDQKSDILKKVKNIKPFQPINISEENYITLKENVYQVTNKLDGERSLIYCSNAMYLISKKNVNYIGPANTKIECLLDTEFFKGKYYVFDCYIYEGRNISNKLLSHRLKCANEIVKTNPLLIMKKFSLNLLEYSEELLNTLNKDENDGLIYTPENPQKGLEIFKWKFPEKMSIDFRVKSDGQMSIKEKGVFKTTFFYRLCVYTKSDKDGNTPFRIKDTFATYSSDSKLIENGIYEFIYQGKFILLRQRQDKILPNFIKTAYNVWKDIIHPFESYKLLDMFRPLYKYRKYHNRIKRDMINKFCKHKTILDLGVGRGGDLFKYEKAESEQVFGVEPYETNYKDLEKRLVESVSSFKDKVKLITTTAQDTNKIIEEIGEGVDVVSSFFSLSFFFFPSKPEDLINFVQTVSQSLKEGGRFIGTTIDGEKTKKLLMDKPDKKFNFDDGFIKMNPDETITFEVKGTIVESQLESLVDFDRLVKELKSFGIECEETSFFEESDDLTRFENILNRLYRKFVFKKNKLSDKIDELSTEIDIYDLMTQTKDEKCIKMFEEYLKIINKFDVFKIPPEHHYNVMTEFYNMKKFINPYNSINLLKAYCLYGDRLNKTYVREKIPKNAVLLKDYKKKENYPALRDQLIRTLELFKDKIDYQSLKDGLMVSEQKDGLVRLIFTDYSKMKIMPSEFKDPTDLISILEFL